MAAAAAIIGMRRRAVPVRDAARRCVALAAASRSACRSCGAAPVSPVAAWRAATRTARVAAMTGIDRGRRSARRRTRVPARPRSHRARSSGSSACSPRRSTRAIRRALSVARTVVGAAFLGSVTDAMLLGHWYLVQPGLARGPLLELVRWVEIVWPFEILVMLWPTGMVSVSTARSTTATRAARMVLGRVRGHHHRAGGRHPRRAPKERAYSAVMAATGLLYLAILTAFGTDLVARAVLAP